MRRGLIATASLLSCSAHAPPPAPPPSPSPPAAVDVDSSDCGSTLTGRLFTRWGAFWFDAAWQGREGEPQPTEGRGSAQGEVLLSVHDDTPGASESPPWYGTVAPLSDSTFGVCVRSYHPRHAAPGESVAPDALVKVDPRGLHPEVLYTSGHRLHLVGRLSGAIIVAELTRDGHQLVALDGNGHEIARSRAVVFPPGVVDERRTELTLRAAAPVDLHRLAIVGENDHVFVAEVRDTAIDLRDTGALAPGGFALRGNTLVLVKRAGRCAVVGRAQPTAWRARPAIVCPRDMLTQSEALPVDGSLMSGVRGDALRCNVRSGLTLPTTQEALGSGVTVIADRSVTGERLDMELLVRGRRVSVTFAPTDGAGALAVPNGFGVSLPQGAFVARPVTVDDATLWRVHLSATVPLRAMPTCLQGRWVVRAWSDEGESEDAATTRFDELGTCE